MSLQICPKCAAKNFTWFIDEEVSTLTQWLCGTCSYKALEDESREIDCSTCGALKMQILIEDPNGFYRWCSSCNFFARTKESF